MLERLVTVTCSSNFARHFTAKARPFLVPGVFLFLSGRTLVDLNAGLFASGRVSNISFGLECGRARVHSFPVLCLLLFVPGPGEEKYLYLVS